eukprot:gene3395-5940_t
MQQPQQQQQQNTNNEGDLMTQFQYFFDTLGESNLPKKYTTRAKTLNTANAELFNKTSHLVGGTYHNINQTVSSLNPHVTDTLNTIQSTGRNVTFFNDQLFLLTKNLEKCFDEYPGMLKL